MDIHSFKTHSETTTTTTMADPLDAGMGELSSQPCHSLMSVAWHKVGDSTLWTVLSGRLGEAWIHAGDCRGSVSSPMMGDLRVALRTRVRGVVAEHVEVFNVFFLNRVLQRGGADYRNFLLVHAEEIFKVFTQAWSRTSKPLVWRGSCGAVQRREGGL